MSSTALFGRSGGAGGRRYAAAAGPHGIHVVEYVRDRRGLEVVRSARRSGPVATVEEVARGLAEIVAELGGRGGRGGRGGTMELGLSGFGSAHHILTLPGAAPEILEPIVHRELLRYYPDLREPVIGFTVGPAVDGEASIRREILVGAVPRPAGEALHAGLAARGLSLTHLTVLPKALQGVYDAFDADTAPAVTVLLLDSGPLIGCFYEAALRLFIEPPLDIHGRPLRAAQAVAEQVARATLFLRQQFPASSAARVLVATADGDASELETALRGGVDGEVKRFSDLPAGSLAALGSALDAESAWPLQLLPHRVRPRGSGEMWTRRVAAAAAAIVVAASAWWAGSALLVARAEAEAAQAAEARVVARVPWLTQAAGTLEAREAHAQRVAFLERTVASREQVGRMLAAVADAALPSIRMEAIHVTRDEDGGWSLLLAGVATGSTGAAAVRSVDALYRGIPERLPVTGVDLGELEGLGDGDGPVAIAFDMTFIVQWQTDLQR